MVLEENDIRIMKELLQEQLQEKLQEQGKEIREQFAEHKKEISEQLAEHKKEISEQLIESKQENAGQMKSLEKRLGDKIEARAIKTERMLLNEMERYHEIYVNRMDRIEKDVADLKQHYRIYRIEQDNTGMLLNIVDDLQTRVERLELIMA